MIVTDLDHAWANVFVPEPAVPRVKTGAGGHGAHGRRQHRACRARSPSSRRAPEFTPRNVQTADERSKLVYRIKVTVDNASGVLKQGMPVDAELLLP